MSLRAPYATDGSKIQTGVAVVAGDTIVVCYQRGLGSSTPTCADNASGGSNTYSAVGSGQSFPNSHAFIEVFIAKAAATETVTITVTDSLTNYPSMQVHVYSGSSYPLASILDAYAYDTDEPSSGTAHTSATISTATANCQLVVFWSFYVIGGSPTEDGTGFTRQTALNYAASFNRLVASTGAYSENANTPSADFCGNVILALKMDVPSLPGPPLAEIQSLTPSADLTFLVLDCSVLGGSTYYFSPEPNALGNSVVWQGVTYTTLPFEHEGFAWSTKGPLPRPKVRVAALDGLVGGLARSLQDLVGAKVILKRTHARYLDAVNFPGGVNPSADPNAGHPDEPWVIERKTLEDNVSGVIEFELTTPPDNQNANIPGRRITANVCGWNDASVCSYSVNGLCAAGLPVGVQAKTLAACKVHWGATADIPFGAFPGCARIK